MITLKASDITFDLIQGKSVPDVNGTDLSQTIKTYEQFHKWKRQLIERWGNIMVKIAYGKDDEYAIPWYDQVQYDHKPWIDLHKQFVSQKAEWCESFGCE